MPHPDRSTSPPLALVLVAITAATLSIAGATAAQQVADTTFDTTVAHPAFTARHPKVLFDEAHHNFHTSTGRYKVFAELMTANHEEGIHMAGYAEDHASNRGVRRLAHSMVVNEQSDIAELARLAPAG